MLKLHVLFNYYPAIGVIFATLMLACGLWFRKTGVKRFALKLFVFLTVLTFLVALAGEVASWAADSNSGPRGAALTGHRHFATTAFAVTAITGIIALIGLVRSGPDPDRGDPLCTMILILGIVTSILLVTTILKGRQVKWVVAIPAGSSKVLISIDTENKLWHA